MPIRQRNAFVRLALHLWGGVTALGEIFSKLPKFLQNGITVSAFTALASLGVVKIAEKPAQPPVHAAQDSLNVQIIKRLDGFDSLLQSGLRGLTARADRSEAKQERMEILLAKALGPRVLAKIKKEQREKAREDSIRKELFPFGDSPTDQNSWPAFKVGAN